MNMKIKFFILSYNSFLNKMENKKRNEEMLCHSLLKRDKHVKRTNERTTNKIQIHQHNGNVMGYPITPYIQ